MEVEKKLDAIHAAAMDLLCFAKEKIVVIYNGNKGEPIAKFIEMVFDWRSDKRKAQYVWTIFNEGCFQTETLEFLPSFCKFLTNLQDDTYFEFRWQKFLHHKGGYSYVDCEETDERAQLKVYMSGDGSRDFQQLIDLMMEHDRKAIARQVKLEG